jgi:hypothetical protein
MKNEQKWLAKMHVDLYRKKCFVFQAQPRNPAYGSRNFWWCAKQQSILPKHEFPLNKNRSFQILTTFIAKFSDLGPTQMDEAEIKYVITSLNSA